jgi:hypothetical protein
MYKVKIGILLQKNHSDRDSTKGRYWRTFWEEWGEDMDIENLLVQIKNDTQQQLEDVQVSDQVCHVVCIETAPADEGIFLCNGCDVCFDEFDEEVGDNCCPFCGSKDIEGVKTDD